MLRIKTYIGPSKINGFGCFAAESIKKGKVIWRWDRGIDRILFLPLNPTLREFVEKYGYRVKNEWYLCVDNARFMNHSDKPNVDCLDGYDKTLKNIKVGEELTCNYGQICEDFKGFK